MAQRFDVAIVGAGIVGLAHATLAARAGKKVLVVERSPQAVGASIRNFGMIWPIGQPPGEMRTHALRSRTLWLETLKEANLWHNQVGSMHLAYAEDELDLLQDFSNRAQTQNYTCEIIPPEAVLTKSPKVKPQNLRGALYSPDELCVFPRQVVAELPHFLRNKNVEFRFNTVATKASPGTLEAGGQTIEADHIFLCTGDDFETLFPEHFAQSGLIRTKLQMLRARPKTPFHMGTHLCAGLTLGHYNNFKICPGLEELWQRLSKTWPAQVQYGIHLLVSQHEDGNLTIGDSHEYHPTVTPFLQAEIEHLILAYLDTFLPINELEVFERWHGVYCKHPTRNYYQEALGEGISVLTAPGGAGMTLSYGLAEKHLADHGLVQAGKP